MHGPTPRSVDAIARGHVSPDTVKEKANPAFNDIEPFVFAFMIVRSWTTARWSDVEKRRELLAGLPAIEQYDYCVAKRMQRTAFVRADKKRTGE